MSRNQVGVAGNACLVMGLAIALLQQFTVLTTELRLTELEIQSLDPGTTVDQQHAEWRATDPEVPVQTADDLENQKKQLEQEKRSIDDLDDAIEKVIDAPSESAEKQRESTAHPEMAKLEQKHIEEMEKLRGKLDGRRDALEEKYANALTEVRDSHLDNFDKEAAKQIHAKTAQHRQERDNLQADLVLSEQLDRDR